MKESYRNKLRAIMSRAWRLFRKMAISFAEALHRAWISEKAKPINAERIESAKAAARITEDVNTWAAWREAGYEVQHGSKALFSVDLIHGSKGDGASYRASFFGSSQVKPIPATA